jgi:hypothetical protein
MNNNALSDEGFTIPQGKATDIHGPIQITRKQLQKLGDINC